MRDVLAALLSARRFTGRFLLTAVIGFATVGAGIGLMTTSAFLISKAARHPPILDLAVAIVGVRFFGIARGVLRYTERLVSHDLTFRLLRELRVSTFRALTRLAPAGIERFRSGDVLSRIVADVDTLQHVYTRVATPPLVALAVAALAATAGALFLPAVGVVIALALLTGILLVPLLTGALGTRHGRIVGPAKAALSIGVIDIVQGAPEIAAFGREQDFLDEIELRDAELTRSVRSAAWLRGFGEAAVIVLTGAAVIGTLVFAVEAVSTGRLDGIYLAVLVMLAMASFEAVSPLPEAFQQLGASADAARRLTSLAVQPLPVPEPADPTPGPHPGRIVLENVWLRYGADKEWVLRGVDIRLDPGRRVALVGASGAGKTSVAEVLLRFRPIDRGSFRISGTNVNQFSTDAVRRVIGLAGDDAHAFNGTIRDNLLIGNPDATDDQMRDALTASGLRHWPQDLVDGWETPVGELGTAISGGERRRLSLARTLLAEFSVLILDEPTAGLDDATSRAVMADYLDATTGRTTLLITHRPEGLHDMDEVLFLADGVIAARGPHNELVGSSEAYRDLWQQPGD